jgi:hypothetical protein
MAPECETFKIMEFNLVHRHVSPIFMYLFSHSSVDPLLLLWPLELISNWNILAVAMAGKVVVLLSVPRLIF